MVEWVEDGVLNSKLGLVGKLEWAAYGLQLVQDESPHGLHGLHNVSCKFHGFVVLRANGMSIFNTGMRFSVTHVIAV